MRGRANGLPRLPGVMRLRLVASAGVLALLAACSGTAERPKPTPLVNPAPAAVRAELVWNQRVGAVAVPVRLAVTPQALVVASGDGAIAALDPSSGRELWRAAVGAELAAGVGSDGRWAAVVTRPGDLVVVEAGQVRWRQRLPARTLTPPLVAGERVFVVAVDRSVHAYDAETGHKLWSVQRPGDPLTLSQPGVLLAVRDTLVVGQGPRVSGLDPLRGNVRWEVPVAAPRGTNEVERLADLVGPAARDGDTVCVRAFQSAVACVDTERGALAWTRASSGAQGLAIDAARVYGVDSTDRITAYRRASGEAAWTAEQFRFRGLTAPVVVGNVMAAGDAEGYVHLLARDTGQPVGRLATDGSAVVAPPVVAGGLLVVMTRNGGVHAFRLP